MREYLKFKLIFLLLFGVSIMIFQIYFNFEKLKMYLFFNSLNDEKEFKIEEKEILYPENLLKYEVITDGLEYYIREIGTPHPMKSIVSFVNLEDAERIILSMNPNYEDSIKTKKFSVVEK